MLLVLKRTDTEHVNKQTGKSYDRVHDVTYTADTGQEVAAVSFLGLLYR